MSEGVSQHTHAMCHHCTRVQNHTNRHCDFCLHRLHQHDPHSLQRTWAFLITGILLYVPANLFPIMVSTSLGNESPSTIIGGVVLLWEHQSYPIAMIIFIASVLVPLAKFLALIYLCVSQQFGLFDKAQQKITAYRLTEIIGRWSMVDVFVVAFLVSLIQLGNLMSIVPGPAVLAFAGMVISTMLAATSLDSKLFWETHER
jgi:paraquat-inducible protein A